MPGRQFDGSSLKYRYGFNGKENDNEVKGDGNQQDYGMRIYDPRLGRFLSVDPLTKDFTELTPYQFSSNIPIEAIDLDGLEAESSKKDGFWKSFGKSVFNGIVKTVLYFNNNPSHVGYGGGTLPSTGKPPTPADFKRYEINWRQQLDPQWQIENFSFNLVYGTSNFVGGIIEQDGKRTAEAIPPLLGTVGTIAGLKGLPSTTLPGLSVITKGYGAFNFKLSSELKPGTVLNGFSFSRSSANLTKKVSEFKLTYSAETITKSSDYKAISALSDEQLVNSVVNPKNYNKVTVNTETGTLFDGNTRIYELQRRGLGEISVPYQTYTPDNSMFPKLKEPPKKN